jgi:hypothetical protein
MRVGRIWSCAAALLSGLSGLAGVAQAEPYPLAMAQAPLVEFVDEPQGPCRAGVMAGGSVYFLRPYHTDNPAFVVNRGIGTATPTSTTEDFDWSYRVAPAGWIGYTTDCGVGIRARYFFFDHDSEGITRRLSAADAAAGTAISAPEGLSPLLGTPPRGFGSPGVLLQGPGGAPLGSDTLIFGSDLHIQTLDLEGTFAYDHGHFSLLLAVGGRYLQMHQNYVAGLSNIVAPDTFEQSILTSGRNFYGGGPTLAFQCRWQIAHSGLALYGTARGSIVVGRSRNTAVYSERIADPFTGSQENVAMNSSLEEYVLPVGELEGGLEYGKQLGHARVFIRGAVVNHTYFEAGSATSRDGALGLFGAQVSLGINY